MLNEFKKFILRGNVVDLAVGIAIGAAFTSVVNALVKDIIDPLVALFYGGNKLADASLTLKGKHFLYGDLINNIVTFLIVAAVVFFLVVKPINKLSGLAFRGKGLDDDSEKCPHCLSIIPKNATRCKFCTSSLGKKTMAIDN